MNTINIYIESRDKPEENNLIINEGGKGQQKTSYVKEVLVKIAGKSRIQESTINPILSYLYQLIKFVFISYFGGPDGTCTRNPGMSIPGSFYKRAHSSNKTHQDYRKCRNYKMV